MLPPLKSWLTTYPVIVLAYSGGRDSAALLHSLIHTAATMPGARVIACHIHHGLQDIADHWITHTEQVITEYQSQGLPVSLEVHKVHVKTGPQLSIEDQARRARYKVLETCVKENTAGALMLGHHLQDQAETFLLQAVRGSGVSGLSAMPTELSRNGVTRIRPWLQVSRSDIEHYVKQHTIPYVDDPSNDATDYLRNKIRLNVLPELRSTIPGVDKALASSASYCAEANEALQWVAQQDLEHCTTANTFNPNVGSEWPLWRKKNVLRAWYQALTGHPLPANALDRAVEHWATKRPGLIQCPNGGLIKWATSVSYQSTPKPLKPFKTLTIEKETFDFQGLKWTWHGPLPFTVTMGPQLEGASMALAENRPNRPLKKQYQSEKVTTSEKEGLFWYTQEHELLYAPGLGTNFALPYRLNCDGPVQNSMADYSNFQGVGSS